VSRRAARRRRRPLLGRLLTLLAIAAAFLAGFGLGEALHDRPQVAGTQTIVRTIEPLPPAAATTTTTTTTGTVRATNP
jgi:hypothetical protein